MTVCVCVCAAPYICLQVSSISGSDTDDSSDSDLSDDDDDDGEGGGRSSSKAVKGQRGSTAAMVQGAQVVFRTNGAQCVSDNPLVDVTAAAWGSNSITQAKIQAIPAAHS